jgi:Holliday junction DNA helicase RuvB
MNYVVEGFYKFTDEDIEDMVKGLAKEDDEMPLFDFLKPQKSVEPDIFSPTSFDEYIGQNGAKNAAKIMVQAASIENRPIPNILIDGPYGLGKTTLAKLIMDAAGLPVKIIDGSSVKDADISGTLIIDEIHNIPSEICDSLNVKIDQGSLHIIGCTTRLGGLPDIDDASKYL